MSSRFVAAGEQAESVSSETEWAKARKHVENQRHNKPAVQGQQENGKSLYEVLEANKAAKQEAFEEASKLKNQFRPLDDGEIEFLESIRKSENAKEASIRVETAEQIEQFRRQRAAAEQRSSEVDDDIGGISSQPHEQELWTTSKKRRREKTDTETLASKIKRVSQIDPEPTLTNRRDMTTDLQPASTSQHNAEREKPPVSTGNGTDVEESVTRSTKPSLVSYDSSDDD